MFNQNSHNLFLLDSSILPPVSTPNIISASVTQERISKQREYISHRDDIELPRIR